MKGERRMSCAPRPLFPGGGGARGPRKPCEESDSFGQARSRSGSPQALPRKGRESRRSPGSPGAPTTEAGVEVSGSPQEAADPKRRGRGQRLLAAAAFWSIHDRALLADLGDTPSESLAPEAVQRGDPPEGAWSWAVLG